jgi:diketogulonate reductase-like aldo/keto reductase
MNKNKNTIHNQKHLTLTERTYTEQELVQGSTFSSIAAVLNKDPWQMLLEFDIAHSVVVCFLYFIN